MQDPAAPDALRDSIAAQSEVGFERRKPSFRRAKRGVRSTSQDRRDALTKLKIPLHRWSAPWPFSGTGLRRFTEDVDILVTKGDLKKIHEALDGLGYLPPHKHSKHLRDTELGVRIEFLTTGEYPGDGQTGCVSLTRRR